MPTSDPVALSPVCQRIIGLKPLSVLDIGFGFGKWGILAREYAGIWCRRDDGPSPVRVDGIEVFPDYITPLQRLIYDNIYIGNALDIIPKLEMSYDLALMVDVLEHFSVEDGKRVLGLIQACSAHALIITPRYFGHQGAAFGNENEKHISHWSGSELAKWGRVCGIGVLYLLEM